MWNFNPSLTINLREGRYSALCSRENLTTKFLLSDGIFANALTESSILVFSAGFKHIIACKALVLVSNFLYYLCSLTISSSTFLLCFNILTSVNLMPFSIAVDTSRFSYQPLYQAFCCWNCAYYPHLLLTFLILLYEPR